MRIHIGEKENINFLVKKKIRRMKKIKNANLEEGRIEMNIRIYAAFLAVSVVITGVLLSQAVSKEDDYGPAATVVAIFCEQDALGIRLSSLTWKYVKPLISWDEEPGWDTVFVIDGFNIIDESYSNLSAKVVVRYYNVRLLSYDNNGKMSLSDYKQQHDIAYNLVYDNKSWKIDVFDDDMPPAPYVYVESIERQSKNE